MKKIREIWFAFFTLPFCGLVLGQVPTEPHADLSETPQPLISRHCAYLQPRRVVIVTTDDRQDRLKEQQLFSATLEKHLRHGQRFDVVVARDRVCQRNLPMRRGRFDEHELLALSERYNADCVLYCELEQISAYEPMQLQTSILIVHVAEAVSLVAATSTIDLRDPKTRHGYLKFLQHRCRESTTDTTLHSPSQLIDYASSRLAGVILSVWPP